ncbi:uncharacterized protein VTP21DRAFT_9896 [Calcarisporiella thermophila]|uniref:uncharacterized protein n=1 Tax=Calcarisporiella thermophila TaxID=911321 RepID=UPI0037443CF8
MVEKDKEKDKEREKLRYRYQTEIQQMMFVFGEVADPLPETTQLVEDIVRSQVIEIIIQAATIVQRRGSRYMNAEDLIFLIRHDRAKVNRLRQFLSWKEVRKNAKDAGGGDAVEDMLEEPNADKPGKTRRVKVKLSWELVNAFSDAMVNADSDEEDEEEEEAYDEFKQRLKEADEITRAMTREEYVHYSECRQASFTYRKAKRFRDWANMAAYIDMKPNDDVIDILGFLTFEMVSTLTEMALQVKKELTRDAEAKGNLLGKRKREDAARSENGDRAEVDNLEKRESDSKNMNGEEGEGNNAVGGDDEGGKSSYMNLFSPPPSEQTPLQPSHIHEAFRRLQRSPQPLKNFRGGLVRTRVSLI